MDYDIQAFESLGSNCEFGFFLRDKGNDSATLLKWADVLQVTLLTNLIKDNFQHMLEIDNICPYNEAMVLDRPHMIAWHTPLRAQIIDPTQSYRSSNLRFTTPADEFSEIWKNQTSKITHLIERMRLGLASGQFIYVFKARPDDPVTESKMIALHDALNLYGPNKLLVVTLADAGNEAGSLREIRPGLLHGFVDRFAPGNRAGDYSEGPWNAICAQAYKRLAVRRPPRRFKIVSAT